ncbi:MAG: hypothetical protein OXC59_03130, partial [Acidimicrobiaceae bacterium]|nr:hypothetical protein [Acidimicrobiaceae bacterium]
MAAGLRAAGDFRAGAFLAVAVRAGVFLAGVFLAVAVRAGVFLAGVFLASDLLAAADLAEAVFPAATELGAGDGVDAGWAPPPPP